MESLYSGVESGNEDKEDDASSIPDIQNGMELTVREAVCKDGKTVPPKHYTEATLLQAMENAGAEEMPEDAERKGLGTPATRAGIIEKLVRTGFLERTGEQEDKVSDSYSERHGVGYNSSGADSVRVYDCRMGRKAARN